MATDPLPQPPRAPNRGELGDSPPFTAVFSDLHLSDVETLDPARPLWRRHKHRDLVCDEYLVGFLDHVRELANGARVELVLNGDVFDFDGIAAIPDDPPFPVSWLERRRGLAAEEAKSAWKMRRILADHPVFLRGLADFVARGNELVFVIGNHDLELHWPAVQAELFAALGTERVRICEWFTISGGDTLITHGNQLDAYCVCQDPVNPCIEVRGRVRVRSPFGNLAGKLMLNGMGLFNPHVDDSFIKPLRDYVAFFVRYVARYQPLIAWTWFWTALATLWVSLSEGFAPAVRDPMQLEQRESAIAHRARTTPRVVRALRAIAVHSAVFDPIKVARELWLDRALLLLLVFFLTAQVFSAMQLVTDGGFVAAAVAFVVLLVPFVRYARSVGSDVRQAERAIEKRLPQMASIAGVTRVVMGHTHRELHRRVGPVEYLNTGHWSPAFADVACTRPIGRNAFGWIAPGPGERVAELRVFRDGSSEPLPGPERATFDAAGARRSVPDAAPAHG